jgi:hypothetical protein
VLSVLLRYMDSGYLPLVFGIFKLLCYDRSIWTVFDIHVIICSFWNCVSAHFNFRFMCTYRFDNSFILSKYFSCWNINLNLQYVRNLFSFLLVAACYSIFSFMCMFCRSLFILSYFFFWPLCCLFFFEYTFVDNSRMVIQQNSKKFYLKSVHFFLTTQHKLSRAFQTDMHNEIT